MTQVERVLLEERERVLSRPFHLLPRDERMGRPPVKLPVVDEEQIRALRAQGLTYKVIAKQMNVSPSTVCRVMKEKS